MELPTRLVLPTHLDLANRSDRTGILHLYLLTHATELTKSTNTGALIAPALAEHPDIKVHRVLWSRVAPDPRLIEDTGLALIYPALDAKTLSSDAGSLPRDIQGVILLDATWQLAQKMYNQSPYLKQLPAYQLASAIPSVYRLRRNQRQLGWCTAECAAMVLGSFGAHQAAEAVMQQFLLFNSSQ